MSVFERSTGDGWQLTTELTEGVYIESMAVADDTAVLRTADSDGLVDVFEREGGEWRRRQTLSATDRDDGRIVRSIATDGDTLLVSAPHAQFGDSVGAVYNLDQPSSTNDPRGIYFKCPIRPSSSAMR